jgi:beta-lactamase superfamily II metal-dependent hydrolase
LKAKYQETDFPLQFDLIKVSHHGSIANNSPELFQLVDSPRYVISTNGQGTDHPDLATLAWIVSRKTSFKRMIHFNYNNSGYQFLDNEEWMEKYQYGISTPSEGSSEIVKV